MTTKNEFDLTPNYGVIFKQFAKDAANAGEYLSAALYRAQTGPGCWENTPEIYARRAAVLRAIQEYLAPVTIALQCATSVAEVEQVREVMAETLKRVDTWAAEFEGLSETGEDE